MFNRIGVDPLSRVAIVVAFGSCLFSLRTSVAAPPSQAYRWRSVQMVGGGFVDGIVFHPTAKDVRYARTDIGGAYRWNARDHRWDPILDWLTDRNVNLMGVESIALDRQHPERVYLGCGMYTNDTTPNAAVLRSEDGGKTFQRADLPFKMGGNEDGRGNGERMAVDPNDGDILYLGSRTDGLWRSDDRGASWKQVSAFASIKEAPPTDGFARWFRPNGIISVVFDPSSGAEGKPTATLYVAASVMGQNNLFRSVDAGVTWQPVTGEPTNYRPTRMVLASNHTLYIAYGTSPGPSRMTDGGLWKLDTITGQWTDITPEKPDPDNGKAFGYAAVSVDSRDPRMVIASSFGRPGGEDIFRTTDGGATWHQIFRGQVGGTYDFSKAPYVSKTPIHWLFDVEIDPLDPAHALFTTGYGGYETFDLTDSDAGKPTKWSVMSTGIEETVLLEMVSPLKGPHLITAIGDYGGFVHNDLDKPAPDGNFANPRFGNTTGVAYAGSNPDVIVRVGNGTGENSGKNLGYSLDGGQTWQPAAGSPPTPPTPPVSADTAPWQRRGPRTPAGGSIAVSADGGAWVWTPGRMQPYVTQDRGATWTACAGLDPGVRVIADPFDAKRFYALALFDGKLYTSRDGGLTFDARSIDLPGGKPQSSGYRYDNRGGQDRLYAAPTQAGDLWIAAFDALYHSVDSGSTWTKIGNGQEVHAFGFGKAAPHKSYPAIYMIGVLDGVRGVFRSDDTAATWTRINDDQHQWGLMLQVTGDPRLYGRVYVGTHGRGVIYGDIAH